ncbi:MAG TPA: rod shape-determining protein MreC [Candidatus Acidoferrales bacterium]|nr:rod shape-determining protein MreC [Candidatus Acidoferrales bacterium]
MAALLVLVQINAERAGATSPLTAFATSLVSFAESGATIVIDGARNGVASVAALPSLEKENVRLREQNRALAAENARLHELAAQYSAQVSVRPVVDLYPSGIEARVIGFPPEDDSRTVTIDRGANAGVKKDDGVLASGGVVGRVESVSPLSSEVVLITDYTSRIPAVTRRGRYWGIARGNLSSVRVEYIPQDAAIKVGDAIVTGQGRSFRSGEPIGTIVSIERGDAALYQTAVLKPAVDLGSLDRVVVVPQ